MPLLEIGAALAAARAGFGLFHHVDAPRWLAGVASLLALAVVTPDLHRVHRSARPDETDSNYSSVFPIWDRLLGTYVAEPAQGHDAMTVGLPAFREPRHRALGWMLANPFRTAPGGPQEGPVDLR